MKIRILLKFSKNVIKTIPKIFNEIYQSLYKFISIKVYCILNKVKDCDLRKFAKVWTNFGNLIENFKSFSENFNKNSEKFNENLKFFLLLILILSASKTFVFGGERSPGPPLEPLLTVFCNQLIIYSYNRKSRSRVKRLSK